MKRIFAISMLVLFLVGCGGGGGGSSSSSYTAPAYSGNYSGQWTSQNCGSSGRVTMNLVQQDLNVQGDLHLYSTWGAIVEYNGPVTGTVTTAAPPGAITLAFGGSTASGQTYTSGAIEGTWIDGSSGCTAVFSLSKQ